MIATLWIFLALAALARADENGDRDVIRKPEMNITGAGDQHCDLTLRVDGQQASDGVGDN